MVTRMEKKCTWIDVNFFDYLPEYKSPASGGSQKLHLTKDKFYLSRAMVKRRALCNVALEYVRFRFRMRKEGKQETIHTTERHPEAQTNKHTFLCRAGFDWFWFWFCCCFCFLCGEDTFCCTDHELWQTARLPDQFLLWCTLLLL